MKHTRKSIGVIGGMGPQATGEFYSLLLAKSANEYGVAANDEYPEVVIDSVPVPDFISNTASLSLARRTLMDRVIRLNDFGVGQICIACNTAHILLPDLRRVSHVPVVSIMEEVHRRIKSLKYRRIGLLATPVTYNSGLYNLLKSNNTSLIIPSPDEQEMIERFIRAVIAGKPIEYLKRGIVSFGHAFVSAHKLDAVVLGCTELPLIFPRNVPAEVIDTLDVLADSVLDHYYYVRRIYE